MVTGSPVIVIVECWQWETLAVTLECVLEALKVSKNCFYSVTAGVSQWKVGIGMPAYSPWGVRRGRPRVRQWCVGSGSPRMGQFIVGSRSSECHSSVWPMEAQAL